MLRSSLFKACLASFKEFKIKSNDQVCLTCQVTNTIKIWIIHFIIVSGVIEKKIDLSHNDVDIC